MVRAFFSESALFGGSPWLVPAVLAGVILVLLAVSSSLHLNACCKDKELLRRITKILLVPFIMAEHIVLAGFTMPLVLIALFFGWLGDIFLIPRSRKLFFGCGALLFLVGHIFYIWAAFRYGGVLAAYSALGPWSAYAAVAAALAVVAAAYLRLRKKLPKSFRIPCLVYMLAIGLMACSMIYSALGTPNAGRILAAVGAVLFVSSDYMLASSALGLFRARRRSMWVMLTYILAQAFIAVGFAIA